MFGHYTFRNLTLLANWILTASTLSYKIPLGLQPGAREAVNDTIRPNLCVICRERKERKTRTEPLNTVTRKEGAAVWEKIKFWNSTRETRGPNQSIPVFPDRWLVQAKHVIPTDHNDFEGQSHPSHNEISLGEMAQWVRAFVTKPDDKNSISWTHLMEEQNRLP